MNELMYRWGDMTDDELSELGKKAKETCEWETTSSEYQFNQGG